MPDARIETLTALRDMLDDPEMREPWLAWCDRAISRLRAAAPEPARAADAVWRIERDGSAVRLRLSDTASIRFFLSGESDAEASCLNRLLARRKSVRLEVRVAEDKPQPAPDAEAAEWVAQLREWAADREHADFCADDCRELARLVERLAEGRG